MKQDLQLPLYAKASLILIGIFVFVNMLVLVQHIIVPIIYSIIIAIVLSPIVNFLVQKKMNRVLAIVVTLLFVIATSVFIATLLSIQLMEFTDTFPQLVENFNLLSDQAVAWTSDCFNISTPKINGWIVEKKQEMLNGTSAAIGKTIINTGSMLVVLVLIPVYVFLILLYQSLFIDFIHQLFSIDKRREVSKVLTATKGIIQSYLVGILLEALIVSILNVSTLLLLGIDYAILLGVIGALLNIIPYIGGIIAVALPMIIALATKAPSYAFLVLAAYLVIQIIDNNYIFAKVVAKKVQINALVSIVAVIAGGVLWGTPGMFLSVPLTAILKVIFDNVEPLKPWGFLLGNTMPPILRIKGMFKNKESQ